MSACAMTDRQFYISYYSDDAFRLRVKKRMDEMSVTELTKLWHEVNHEIMHCHHAWKLDPFITHQLLWDIGGEVKRRTGQHPSGVYTETAAEKKKRVSKATGRRPTRRKPAKRKRRVASRTRRR